MRDDKVFSPSNARSSEFETKGLMMQKPWKLESIYEAGLVPDMARYKNVEVVFGPLHIFALFGNRADRFPYTFISPRLFEVRIDGIPFKCRITELTDKELVFHADARNGHFIVRMYR